MEISKKKFKEIEKRDKGKCVYCGADWKHLDHLIPKSKGGSNEVDNLFMSCQKCNSRKSDLSITKFYLKNLEQYTETLRKAEYFKKVFTSIISSKDLLGGVKW